LTGVVGASMKDLVLSVSAMEPPLLADSVRDGLRLLVLTEAERGNPTHVLAGVDKFLSERRRKQRRTDTATAYSVAVQVAAVIGHQLKKSGWRWIRVEWRSPPLPRLIEQPRGSYREVPDGWGLVPASDAFLVLPLYDLLAVQLRRRIEIAIAAHVARLASAQGQAGALELWRLVDEPTRPTA